MKKVLSVLLLIGAMFAIQAAAPTYAAVDGVYEWYIDTTITPGDTIAGASDSTVLVSNYEIETGWQYMMYRTAFTGGATDSVKVYVRVDNNTDAGTLLYATNVDSFTTSGGEVIDLSIGGSNYGSEIDIVLKAYTDNGGELINGTYYILKRRPWNLMRNR